jgi:hypothetical protein
MNILLLSKAEIEKTFQTATVLAPNLLGMNLRGEKAFKIPSPSMNEGYEMIFGFFNDKARYVLFRKVSPKPWEEADMRVGMLQIGRLRNWSSITSDFVDYTEKERGRIVAEATGWQSPARKYCFFYVPSVKGEVPILPDRSTLDLKMSPIKSRRFKSRGARDAQSRERAGKKPTKKGIHRQIRTVSSRLVD